MEQDIKTENEKLYQVCSMGMMRAKIIPRSFIIFLSVFLILLRRRKVAMILAAEIYDVAFFFRMLIANSNNSEEIATYDGC